MNTSRQWRLILALVLVMANLVLVGLNLAKHDLIRLSVGSQESSAIGSGTVPAPSGPTDQEDAVTGTSASAPGEDGDGDGGVGETTVPAGVESTPATVDDWPGGHGPVPANPPEQRRALIEPDGRMQLTGSAPDWATVSKIVQYAGEKLPGGPEAIDNQLSWHPDANPSTQSGDVVLLQAATFEAASSEIDPASLGGLDLAAAILTGHPTVFAIVIGHADNRGADEVNARLAADRAAAVVDYLIGQGVVPGQIVVASAGEDDPAASNDTEEGRAVNRRAEIQFKNVLISGGDR